MQVVEGDGVPPQRLRAVVLALAIEQEIIDRSFDRFAGAPGN